MTIYEIKLPAELEQIAAQIVNQTGYKTPQIRSEQTKALMGIYLRHIESHQWQPKEERFSHVFKQWLACRKCINKVWEYFETRYDNE